MVNAGLQGPPRQAAWLDLGTVDYARAYQLQLQLHDLRESGSVPDIVLVLEHPACITVGRAGRRESILATEDRLGKTGVAVYQSDRGGDVTYHGPGQIVLYAIIDLRAYGRDVHAHARRLEQVLIDVLASYGIEATRKKEYPGVWTARGKIGALGLRVSRWVTLHGVSLNVSPEMAHFSLIIPCGIREHGVTSMTESLGHRIDPAEVKPRLRASFERVFNVELTPATPAQLGLD